MEFSNLTDARGRKNDETVILLGHDPSSQPPPVVVTEGTLPSFVRRQTSVSVTAATPVATPATEMEPLLSNMSPQNSFYEDNGLTGPQTFNATEMMFDGQWTSEGDSAPTRLPKPPGGERRSRKGSRAPQPPSKVAPPTGTNGAGGAGGSSQAKKLAPPSSAKKESAQSVQRPCQAHSFHTEAAEIQRMEKELLTLLSDFNSGKLRAFGHGCSMEEMESIRDQQESLAKLHFDLGGKQDLSAPLTEEGIRTANDNMDHLMTHLERLSVSIGRLDPAKMHNNQEATPSATRGRPDDDLPTYRRPSTYPVKADRAPSPDMAR